MQMKMKMGMDGRDHPTVQKMEFCLLHATQGGSMDGRMVADGREASLILAEVGTPYQGSLQKLQKFPIW